MTKKETNDEDENERQDTNQEINIDADKNLNEI